VPQQISRAQQVFYLGLALMLSMALLSAATGADEGPLIPVLTVTGALLALAAKLWQSHLRRMHREQDSSARLGWFR